MHKFVRDDIGSVRPAPHSSGLRIAGAKNRRSILKRQGQCGYGRERREKGGGGECEREGDRERERKRGRKGAGGTARAERKKGKWTKR